MIDTHCHLTAPQFDADREAVVERAIDAGVNRIICVADDMEDIEPCLKLADRHLQIFATAGAHPHHAKSFSVADHLPRIRAAAQNKRCRAVGEIGLDYHYMHSPKDAQKAVFLAQLQLAKELGLPVIVHCREAIDDVWGIVNRVRPEKLVLHCCSEKWEDVERFVERGYPLSFTGIVTHPKTGTVMETLKRCPLTQLMVETDAPFLAPEPHRGKRNEPAFTVDIAKAIAAIRGISLAEVDAQTTRNAVEFFSLPS